VKLITDFNSTGLERIVAKLRKNLIVDPQPYGQFMQSIYETIDTGYDDVVFLWLDLSSFSQTYAQALSFERFDRVQLESDLDDYIELIEHLAKSSKGVIVSNFVLPSHFKGSGLNNLDVNTGLGFLIAELNLKLYRALSAIGNCYCLDQALWFQSESHYNGKLYHAGKIPFSQKVFKAVAEDLVAGVDAIYGRSKKLLVLDLDDTLWGGILGDDGRENLKLGAPGAQGEAFAMFQREIKSLKNRGIALAIASKNYEDNALDAIANHPEMQLSIDDFSAWRINWDDKANNIRDIAQELNLGLSSVVFIDDNPAERGRVAEELPEVFVPDWPKDPCEYVTEFRKLSCFSVANVSEEDRQKTVMFLQEKQRKILKSSVADKTAWLASLEMKLTIETVNDDNVGRIVQLLNKTNQFNLRTRRLTQGELERWLMQGHQLFAFRVQDRFGDMGITGLLGLEVTETSVSIADFVLSCRVMGRDIERFMLDKAIRVASSMGSEFVDICYEKTTKNRPVFEFLKRENIIDDECLVGKASLVNCCFDLSFFTLESDRNGNH
jgi:FkbH-like protein